MYKITEIKIWVIQEKDKTKSVTYGKSLKYFNCDLIKVAYVIWAPRLTMHKMKKKLFLQCHSTEYNKSPLGINLPGAARASVITKLII